MRVAVTCQGSNMLTKRAAHVECFMTTTAHLLQRPRIQIIDFSRPSLPTAQAQPASTLIWINALPSTGKYTTASFLANKMESQCTLIHNHDLVDAVEVPHFRSTYRTLRKEQRAKAFGKHVLARKTRRRCVAERSRSEQAQMES